MRCTVLCVASARLCLISQLLKINVKSTNERQSVAEAMHSTAQHTTVQHNAYVDTALRTCRTDMSL